MPCLTPRLLTTHDIYSMNGDGFRSALWAHGTLSPVLTDCHGADSPNCPMGAAWTTPIKPRQVIVPSPSTFSLRLLLPLYILAAATEAGDSSGQSCPSFVPTAGHHLCNLPAAAGCQQRSLSVVDTIDHSTRLHQDTGTAVVFPR